MCIHEHSEADSANVTGLQFNGVLTHAKEGNEVGVTV